MEKASALDRLPCEEKQACRKREHGTMLEAPMCFCVCIKSEMENR